MIRASASAAAPRPAVRSASTPRPALLILLLTTVLALAGAVSVAQRAAAAAERSYDDIWVSVDGVAFERGRESDEVAYVVRPAGKHSGGQAYARDLTREEQYNGWTAFREARRAYPDGYCVVWVEVEDASSWHESQGNTVCTAAEPAGGATATATPTPTPTPDVVHDEEPTQAAPQEPAQDQGQDRPDAAPAAPAPTTQAPRSAPAPSTKPTPTPTPTPSPTPSPTASSTPSPTPTPSASETPLLQPGWEQPPSRTVMDAAGEQDEVISPLGWVAVLGSGGVLTAGGFLLLWRRLT